MSKLTTEDEAAFRGALARLGLHDDADVGAALRLMQARELGRGEYLLRGGEQATLMGLLVRGLLREYFVSKKGVERTKSFVVPRQFTGSLADLLSQKPSRAFIVAEEPVRLLLIPYERIRAFERASPAWAAAGRRSVESLLLYKAEREYQFLCLDAQERYQAFTAQHPELEARIAGRHLASYLGITPVHLSRLRARRARTRSTGPAAASRRQSQNT